MASYLERYLNGEREQVWAELMTLGAAVREVPLYSDAWAVASETMRRVRHTIELLVHVWMRSATSSVTRGCRPMGHMPIHLSTLHQRRMFLRSSQSLRSVLAFRLSRCVHAMRSSARSISSARRQSSGRIGGACQMI
jgi:hypothetical protein